MQQIIGGRCVISRKELGWGVLLSYLLMFFNTIYNLVMIPYILTYVDSGDYGVYKSVAAISASLAVMDLGLGATTTRYICRYNITGDKNKASNFLAMIFIQFSILSLVIFCFGILTYTSTNSIYGKTFTPNEIALAKKLLPILIATLILRLFESLLTGVVKGYECFRLFNIIKLISLISKISLLIIVLPLTRNVIVIAYINLLITIVEIIILSIYILHRLKLIPCLYFWDKPLFIESMGYSLLAFVQTLTLQVNGNIDNILIGAMVSSAAVTVYSAALTMFNMYETLSSTLSGMLLPYMTKEILGNASSFRLQNIVSQIGRF